MALLLEKPAAQSSSEVAADVSPKELAIIHGRITPNFHDSYLDRMRMLREATEIEHSLMIQYLYAAFSIKDTYIGLRGDGTTMNSDSAEMNCFTADSDNFVGLAIQEMQHMHTV